MPTSKGRTLKKLLPVGLALAVLAGCASGPSGAVMDGFSPREARGNRATQSIEAALGGGLVAGAVGNLDERDRRRALEAEYRALEYGAAGQAVAWQADGGAVSGSVVAYQPYRVGSQDCRQYAHTVVVAGQSRNVRGAACRNGDGSWSLLV